VALESVMSCRVNGVPPVLLPLDGVVSQHTGLAPFRSRGGVPPGTQ
jgi:hypothetical protein